MVKKRQLNLSYFSPKVEKRSSAIEGRGLFAKQAIRRGEVVVVKGGYVRPNQGPARPDRQRKLGPSEVQITEDLFMGPATKSQREGGMIHLNPFVRAESRVARSGGLPLPPGHQSR
jgi:hypothetical protein